MDEQVQGDGNYMTATEFIHEIDSLVARTMNGSEFKPCCAKGCSHCCSEPLYAETGEVDHMLDMLTEDQRHRVKERTKTWLTKAMPFFDITNDKGLADAFAYRDANIECPFLENHLCMVYERRPMGCRTFFATGNPDHCKMPERRQQKIAEIDFSHPAWMNLWSGFAEDKSTLLMEHVGILVADKLLNEHYESSARRQYDFTD
jgi:Fe-S-cluster containining protein